LQLIDDDSQRRSFFQELLRPDRATSSQPSNVTWSWTAFESQFFPVSYRHRCIEEYRQRTSGETTLRQQAEAALEAKRAQVDLVRQLQRAHLSGSKVKETVAQMAERKRAEAAERQAQQQRAHYTSAQRKREYSPTIDPESPFAPMVPITPMFPIAPMRPADSLVPITPVPPLQHQARDKVGNEPVDNEDEEEAALFDEFDDDARQEYDEVLEDEVCNVYKHNGTWEEEIYGY
jgi:hypothetical protein